MSPLERNKTQAEEMYVFQRHNAAVAMMRGLVGTESYTDAMMTGLEKAMDTAFLPAHTIGSETSATAAEMKRSFEVVLDMQRQFNYPGAQAIKGGWTFNISAHRQQFLSSFDEMRSAFANGKGGIDAEKLNAWVAFHTLRLSNESTPRGQVEGFRNTVYLMNRLGWFGNRGPIDGHSTADLILRRWIREAGTDRTSLTRDEEDNEDLKQRLRVNQIADQALEFNQDMTGVGKSSPFRSENNHPPITLGDESSVRGLLSELDSMFYQTRRAA